MSHALHIASSVDAPRARVWEDISTMDGINAELWPVHMSGPRGLRLDADTPVGVPLWTSRVTLLRVIPIDFHRLQLEVVSPGVGFSERSTSWLERRWEHRRTLSDLPDGTRIEDELVFEPRLLGPLVERFVARVFEGRHRVLRARYGARHELGPPRAERGKSPAGG